MKKYLKIIHTRKESLALLYEIQRFDILYQIFEIFDMKYLIFVMKSRDLINCWSIVRLYIQSLCHVKGIH